MEVACANQQSISSSKSCIITISGTYNTSTDTDVQAFDLLNFLQMFFLCVCVLNYILSSFKMRKKHDIQTYMVSHDVTCYTDL